MTTELRTMLLEANPVPHNEYFDGSDELAAIFSTIQRRTSMVKQDERRPDVVPIGAQPPRRRRTTGLIAAAAFAVVIAVIGGIAAVIGGPTDTTVPPVTTEAPTTTAAPTTTTTATTTETPTTVTPPITDAEQAIIDGMIDAFNAEDVDTFVGYLRPETEVFMSQASNGSDTVPYSTMGEAVAEHQNWRAMLDQRIVLDQPCGASSPGVITCRGIVEGRLYGNLFPVPVDLRFEFNGDQLSAFVFRENELASEPNVTAFFDWVGINHPDDLVTIMGARPTQELIELWDVRLTEYEEFLWRSRLGSDELAVLDGLEAAFNAEDVEGFASYFTLDTLFISDIGSFAGDTLTSLRDRGGFDALTNRMRWRAAMDQTLELVECVRSESGDAIRCDVVLGGPFYGRLGGVKGVLTTEIVDGAVASYSLERNERDFLLVYLPFEAWLEAEVPGINLFPLGAPTEEGIGMWEQYLPDYLASLEG